MLVLSACKAVVIKTCKVLSACKAVVIKTCKAVILTHAYIVIIQYVSVPFFFHRPHHLLVAFPGKGLRV